MPMLRRRTAPGRRPLLHAAAAAAVAVATASAVAAPLPAGAQAPSGSSVTGRVTVLQTDSPARLGVDVPGTRPADSRTTDSHGTDKVMVEAPTGSWDVLGPAASRLARMSGSTVTVRGTVDRTRRTVVADEVATVAAPSSLATTAAVTGPRRLLVVKVTVPGHRNLADGEGRAITDAAVATGMRDTAEFFAATSAGRLQVSHYALTTTLALGLDSDPDRCWTLSHIAADAAAGARLRGLEPATFAHVVHVLPTSYGPACDPGVLARGQAPGRLVWTYGSVAQNTLAHELGHNFGSKHSVVATCRDAAGTVTPLGSNCPVTEPAAADGTDLMGSARYGPNGFQRSLWGWTTPYDVAATGNYLLAPLGSTTSPYAQLVKVQRRNGQSLYLSVRRNGGTPPVGDGTPWSTDPLALPSAAPPPTSPDDPGQAPPTGPPTVVSPATAPPANPPTVVSPAVGRPYLLPGTTMAAGDTVDSADTTRRLTMRPDGNLVLTTVATGAVLWQSSTAGRTGARLVMQTDGNAVLYSTANAALWSSNTAGLNGSYLTVDNVGRVAVRLAAAYGARPAWTSTQGRTGHTFSVAPTSAALYSGQGLKSPDGRFTLAVQPDGNVAVRSTSTGAVSWSTATAGSTGAYLVFGTSGELAVMSAAGNPLWRTGAVSGGADGTAALSLGNDGRLRVALTPAYGSRTVWDSALGVVGNSVMSLGLNTSMGPGASLVAADGTRLTVGADGNVVLTSPSGAVLWQTATAGNPGARLGLDSAGNAAVVGAYGAVRWQSATTGLGAQRLTVFAASGSTPADLRVRLDTVHGSREVWSSRLGLTGASRSQLAPGQFLYSTNRLTSPDGRRTVTMAADGRLVVRDAAGATTWTSNNAASAGAVGYLNPSGSLQVWNSDGTSRLWSSAPAGTSPRAALGNDGLLRVLTSPEFGSRTAWDTVRGATGAASFALAPGDTLTPGRRLVSSDGKVQLVMQADGNLVESSLSSGAVLWRTATASPGARLVMQTDGNLVLYSTANVALWNSGTSVPGSRTQLRRDGQLTVVHPVTGVRFSTGEPVVADPPASQWTTGLTVQLVSFPTPGQYGGLVDTTAGTPAGHKDATLQPGRTLVDPLGGVSVRFDGFDTAGNARVYVTK